MPLVIIGCGHVIHRAGVEPGINASIMYGPAYHDYYSPPGRYHTAQESGWKTRDLQLDVGYAWKFNDKRLLLQADFVAFPGRSNLFGHSIDLYYQYRSSPDNTGVGVMLGLDPKFYLLWGHDIGAPRKTWQQGIDFGFGCGLLSSSLIPQAMYTLRFNQLQTSILLEYRYFLRNDVLTLEDDGSDDYLRSRFLIGLVFTMDDKK
jgi:hypothetical protein